MLPYQTSIQRLLLTLWAGSLWAIGYLAVPLLFYTLDDRSLAGELAGKMFQGVSFIGIVCGLLLIVTALGQDGIRVLTRWRGQILLVMLLLVLVGLLFLQPMMAQIKAQPDWQRDVALAARFSRWHGISSALYSLTSLGALLLVLAGVRRQD